MKRTEQYEQERRMLKLKMKRQEAVRKQERRRRKNKLKGLDKYIIFSFASLIIYTASQTMVTIRTGVESSTLTTCFFSVFGGEVLLCALIKRYKLKNESKEKESGEKDL